MYWDKRYNDVKKVKYIKKDNFFILAIKILYCQNMVGVVGYIFSDSDKIFWKNEFVVNNSTNIYKRKIHV